MEQQLEEVISWLEAGDAADYQAGVLLLQQHSRNRGLVGNLLKKESTANREKLVYELVKIGCGGRMDDVNEVLNHFAQAVQRVADVLTVQEFPEQPAPEQVPEAVRPQMDELTQLMSRLHNQRCQLSNSLADLDPADGPRVVREILSLQDQYNALAQKRRNLAAQPAAPEAAPAPEQPAPTAEQPTPAAEPAAPAVDKSELVQRRNTLRSNISKAKKKAAEAKTEEKRSEYSQKVGKLEVELQQVEMQLALPQA